MAMPDPKAIALITDLVVALGIIVLLTAAAIIANYARTKGRTWASFYFISVGVTPVLAGVVVATVPGAFHGEELISCPSCSSHVRFTANKCASCGQGLTPRPEIGEAIIFRARVNTTRVRGAGFIVAGVGFIGSLISLFQSATDLAKNVVLWEFFWVLFGVGVGLLLTAVIRRFSEATLAKSFKGE
jgi:hypothetical protein